MEMHIQSSANKFDYYRQGEEFEKAMERCFGQLDEEGRYHIFEGAEMLQLSAPCVVNGAFACEMFLKSLLLHYGISIPKTKDGHHLAKLFLLLPTKERDFIDSIYSKKGNQGTLLKQLKRHENDFVKIRYFTEKIGTMEMSPIEIFTLAFNLKGITKYIIQNREWESEV